MKKLQIFLVLLLVSVTVAEAQTYPTTSWSDVADTSWYNSGQDEFTLSTAEAFAGVAQLVADGTTFEGKTINIGADIDLDGNLWTPIGDYPELFAGDVEGNNHTISNLWVNTPDDDYGGLFGYVVSTSFSNIKIDTAHIIGFDSNGTLVANLFDNGSVENCSAINISITGKNNTGGLVGGLVQNSSISNSHAIGDVVGAVQVGGLLGSGYGGVLLKDSYSEGTVTGDFLAGGLVGAYPFAFAGPSTIDNTYSRSLVIAYVERAGGLVGGADNQLLVKNSYSTGTVSAPDFVGATIGFWGSIEMENIYFDTESSGMTEAVGGFAGAPVTPDITGKTTAEMKTTELVDLLNAGSTDAPWSIEATINDGYPILNATLGVQDNNMDVAVKVYPTVFESEFTVSSTMELNSYQIYNISGALISTGALEGNTTTIKAANLSTGVYILTVRSAEGMISKRIIKK
ncbi:T9SS type A sorting domain-containing protein [Aequorivita capsosiphonis]|uniref:T9SS type A sorting domain-containing protein n=1 Tax=Aequorivita capsosiphonis TaxID=487317 RepID=UPI00047EA46B|nr:T9SS type A sorting domain-containing protein [Aequorivita capsosiphonis]